MRLSLSSHTELEGDLSLPQEGFGLVLFAHGSGSSRLSPRNRFVASVLQQAGFGTLLIDLLTEDEDLIEGARFNLDLLSQRLLEIVLWIRKQPYGKDLPIGLFGASTGAASALRVAVQPHSKISAVVSRGGRVDLAPEVFSLVRVPTLLIVGEKDHEVLLLNEETYQALHCPKSLQVVPHATHLFEEPGTLEQVAQLAKDWFLQYLRTV